ncbi:patatin-like phospholipase family protein [Candidatus Roizmanbacteria bacterium]|nr:patatin-like phospholipase family protein [Candidatus Roizmanbacteria bacterium]
MDQYQNFALSLSGGGLSCLAYVGFVDSLKKHQLKPACYAGLSGGALLAILLASNLSTPEIINFFEHLKTLKIINTHFSKLEIIDHKKLTQLIRLLLPYKTFEELPTPAYIFVSNLTKKEPLMITRGDIASAIVASCSLFPLLQPVKRQGLLLGDGGFTVYYGAKFLHNLGIAKVIGIDVTGLTEGTVKGFLSALYKQINSSVTSNARYELSEHPVDLDIKITFPSPTLFTIRRKANHLILLGERTAEHYIPEIKKIVYA